MIPKIIHQIWIGDRYPRPQKWMDTWRDKNPSWDYKVWTEVEIEAFGLINYDYYKAIPTFDCKADVVRYELLERFGGFFIDADSECVRPLDDDLLDVDSFTCYENEINVPGLCANGYLACCEHNELMQWMIKDLRNQCSLETASTSAHHWQYFGPPFLTSSIKKYNYQKIFIYPSYYFIPRHNRGNEYWPTASPVYARQFWGSTRGDYSAGIS